MVHNPIHLECQSWKILSTGLDGSQAWFSPVSASILGQLLAIKKHDNNA